MSMKVWPETRRAMEMVALDNIPPGMAARFVGGISESTPPSAIRRHAIRNGWHATAKQLGVSLSSYFKAWVVVRSRVGADVGF